MILLRMVLIHAMVETPSCHGLKQQVEASLSGSLPMMRHREIMTRFKRSSFEEINKLNTVKA